MSFTTLLVIIALIAFVVAATGLTFKRTDLIAVGLALWSLSDLIGRLTTSLSISTLILLLAFIAFLGAAIGWHYRKLNLIAIGLALWMLSIVLPALHIL